MPFTTPRFPLRNACLGLAAVIVAAACPASSQDLEQPDGAPDVKFLTYEQRLEVERARRERYEQDPTPANQKGFFRATGDVADVAVQQRRAEREARERPAAENRERRQRGETPASAGPPSGERSQGERAGSPNELPGRAVAEVNSRPRGGRIKPLKFGPMPTKRRLEEIANNPPPAQTDEAARARGAEQFDRQDLRVPPLPPRYYELKLQLDRLLQDAKRHNESQPSPADAKAYNDRAVQGNQKLREVLDEMNAIRAGIGRTNRSRLDSRSQSNR